MPNTTKYRTKLNECKKPDGLLRERLLRYGDSDLILAQRLMEWCGHAHSLEEDIALSNLALDLLGLAREWLTLVATAEGKTEDKLAFSRGEREYRNALICELPNGDFGQTILRQFFYSVYRYNLLDQLQHSTDDRVAGIATKGMKESRYHVEHCIGWVRRLGSGTEESKRRMQAALRYLYPYTGELVKEYGTIPPAEAREFGLAEVDISEPYHATIQSVLAEAELEIPEDLDAQRYTGGYKGTHTENLGYILAEMQYLPRSYPEAKW